MPKRLRLAVVVVVVVFVAYFGASYAVFNIALTPNRATCAAADVGDLGAVTALDFKSHDDGTPLSGWLLAPPTPSSPARAVVMIHGLDSCGWTGSHIELAKEYLKKGFTVVVFDLRAQGASGGEHLGMGWLERGDVRAAVDILLAKGFKPGLIGIHGTSFGAGTALLSTAAIPEVGAVVADSAFADVRDLMLNELNRKVGAGALFAPGVTMMAKLRGFDLAEIPPIAAVPKIAPRPIFFLHGTADERIPVEHAKRLKAASTGKDDELWLLEGAGHTQGLKFDREQYLSRTTGFLEKHLGTPPQPASTNAPSQ